MAAKGSKASPKREKALKKLQHVEDALLTVQATVAGYVREIQEVKEMLQPEEGK